MAIDSRQERQSAIGIGAPWRVWPLADGDISGQADRQHMAFLFGQVQATVAVESKSAGGSTSLTYKRRTGRR